MRWQKEKDPLSPREESPLSRISLLPLLAILAGCLTLFSFAIFKESDSEGDISRTVSYFEDFFEENDAIAVFLGWGGGD